MHTAQVVALLMIGACIGSALTFVWVWLFETPEPPAGAGRPFIDQNGEG